MVELNNYEKYYDKRVLKESKQKALNDINDITHAFRRERIFLLWLLVLLFITVSFEYFFTSGTIFGFLIWTIQDIRVLEKKKNRAKRWLKANS